jgi:ABC-type transport system involved in cytochrome c biogenesis permease subunit
MKESTLFLVAFILYIISTFSYLIFLFSRRTKSARAGSALAMAGFIAHTLALIVRTIESSHAPFTNMYESLSFLSWALVAAFVVFDWKFKIPRIGAYLMLIVIALVALASSPLMPKEATPLVPALQSYWLWLHVSVTLVGEAFFAVAFIASIFYLAGKDAEKKKKMDSVSYRSVTVGFPLFTLGGLVFGMV